PRPQPAVTISVWPSGWLCHASRAPGSTVILTPTARAGAGASNRGSIRTVPVKYRLRHLAILGGYTPHIARAVGRLRQDFDQPLRIERLAHELGMSVSGFHHHFKAVTALSPLQFQKRLRLQEARRLMLGEDLDAASAAYR